ncbi:MAG: UDP-N-acetylmuramate dehydrogenase [Treponema sp.]|nr:UDP-N-acetylmuramate dehydrogenase [Treponema sp.]
MIQKIIEQCLSETPCETEIRFNEPMSEHTTFKVGGPADCWLCPDGEGFASFCINLLNRTHAAGIPVFILGGGANIAVSDKGIRGIVLDMSGWTGESVWKICAQEEELIFKGGTTIDEVADYAAAAGFCGLEFLAGMPGTIGGAVWMNARCYGSEISDVLSWVEIIVREQNEYIIKRIETEQKTGFGYKQSPFQNMDCIILSADFKLKKGEKEKILIEMDKNREDRYEKSHYSFPCAGSAFKNNRDFGKPTGQIIDELGLKGLQIGGAQIAPFHGNIVINTGNAAAADIRALMDEVTAKVKAATGFNLEPEILFVGDWG